MVKSFGTRHTPVPQISHQERVNVEMFKAIELLGRKLERAEGERDRLQRRLALIESSASVDEKTGKLYLPVVMDPADHRHYTAPASAKWSIATSLMSSAIALCALGIVLFRDPPPLLTQEQMAALNTLTTTQMAGLDYRGWKKLQGAEETASADTAARKFINREWRVEKQALPDEEELAREETEAADIETLPAPETLAEIEPTRAPQIEPAAGASPETETAAITEQHIPGEDKEPAAVKTTKVKKEVPAPAIKTQKTETAKAEPVPQPVIEETPTPAPVTAKAAPKPTAPPAAKEEDFAAAVPAPTQHHDIARDPALPAKLADLEKRSFEGIPEAQHDLATLYASGKIVAQDYKRAAYWFSQAADGGVANAHYNLGVMFQQGLGVKQDVTKAIDWYEKAAELGHPEAMYNLGIAYIEGVGASRNIDRGVSFFKRAANAGVAQAAYNLGVLYESAFIGGIDYAKAVEWYQVAANEGHAEAEAAIGRIREQTASSDDQALTLADMVEPAAGEEYGQGDATPIEADGRADAPEFSDALIRKIQQSLIHLGYLPGPASGAMDQQTDDAIRAFQRKVGLKSDGVPSQDLIDSLTAALKK